MISFNFETKFELHNSENISQWIALVIDKEGCKPGEINYIFCDDEYLHKLNVEFLNHDTLTDIISFDYTVGKELHGDIYISIERVKENAKEYGTSFSDELHRVIIHGILHYCGYNDKSMEDSKVMRLKENSALKLLTEIN